MSRNADQFPVAQQRLLFSRSATGTEQTEQIQKHDVRCERGANADLSYLYDLLSGLF